MAKRTTVPLSMRGLMQRINRKLRLDGKQLQTARSPRAVASVGRYFINDFRRGVIVEQRVDPEALARELGLLAAWERIENGD